jgi:hypothetical protein
MSAIELYLLRVAESRLWTMAGEIGLFAIPQEALETKTMQALETARLSLLEAAQLFATELERAEKPKEIQR